MPELPWLDATFFGVLGLLIGSFLNVVIYRLPLMMEAQWKAEYADLSGKEPPEMVAFNLMVPRSRCQTMPTRHSVV
jgi:leader peptidase (prepilin peptidase)/N-methyltransferase